MEHVWGTQQHQVSKPQKLHGLGPDLLLGHAPLRQSWWPIRRCCGRWGKLGVEAMVKPHPHARIFMDFQYVSGFSLIFMDSARFSTCSFTPAWQSKYIPVTSLPKSTWWPGHGKLASDSQATQPLWVLWLSNRRARKDKSKTQKPRI